MWTVMAYGSPSTISSAARVIPSWTWSRGALASTRSAWPVIVHTSTVAAHSSSMSTAAAATSACAISSWVGGEGAGVSMAPVSACEWGPGSPSNGGSPAAAAASVEMGRDLGDRRPRRRLLLVRRPAQVEQADRRLAGIQTDGAPALRLVQQRERAPVAGEPAAVGGEQD